ncbi:ABC transporter ATP-binding protein [Halovivax gelatinilyticus]|uniref:ABC transporter ATP-binding protein n=1 Tax=Halovivax gelatinilyticus TaxID=2961597 RepID=UPI0020CA8E0D|nr:ABC transporter ATP-binding protein [Halovivax gelatinilyticus]
MSMESTIEKAETNTEPILSVKNLQTAFFTEKETIRAVDGISFDIRPGETVGIVGESGSGKSVTARSIMGLVESPGRIMAGSSIRYTELETVREYAARFPKRVVDVAAHRNSYDPESVFDHPSVDVTPGDLGFDSPDDVPVEDVIAAGYTEPFEGVDPADFVFVTEGDPETPDGITAGFVELSNLSGESQRLMRGGRIAMVFQDPLTSLNPVYTVGNQIKEALRLHQGLKGEDATREAAALLEAVGIPDARRRVTEYPHQFSGGMRQRAVIAMALACEPEVLICDEPTTALDVTIQAQILDLLAEIQDERDLGIMFITHDMGVIAEISDRVNVMYAGEVVESAGVESLFQEPKHPYTHGLLRSIPGNQTGKRLETIDGNVPTPNEPATYCRFEPRCSESFDECSVVHPVSVPVDGESEDHTAACLLYPESMSTVEAVELHQQRGRTDTDGGEDE